MRNADDLTIIIMVWNRFDFVETTLKFFADMPVRVLIADSSVEPNQFKIHGGNVDYQYNGPVHYFENARMALAAEVRTTGPSVVSASSGLPSTYCRVRSTKPSTKRS